MNTAMKIFGAKATIYLKSHLRIEQLSTILSKGLMLPEIDLEPDEYPPYDITGSCEALGFELWIEKTSEFDNLPYQLKIETEDSINESFKGQMYDLSPWLARYVSKICDIESFVLESEKTGLLFSKGEAIRTSIDNVW